MSGTFRVSWSFSSQAGSRPPGLQCVELTFPRGGLREAAFLTRPLASRGRKCNKTDHPGVLTGTGIWVIPLCHTDPSFILCCKNKAPQISCLIPLKFVSYSCRKVYYGYSQLPGQLFSMGWFIFPGHFGLKATLYHYWQTSPAEGKTEFACSQAKGKHVPFTYISSAQAS